MAVAPRLAIRLNVPPSVERSTSTAVAVLDVFVQLNTTFVGVNATALSPAGAVGAGTNGCVEAMFE